MMRFVVLMFGALLLICTGVRAETVDRIIAKVGNEVITLSDVSAALNAQRALLVQKYGRDRGLAEFIRFKDNILDELVLQKILEAEIKKDGIVVADSEIGQEYQTLLNQYGMNETQFIQQLSQQGLTLAEYRKSLKAEMQKQKFIQKKIMPNIAISDYDLQKEYEKNIRDYEVYSKVRFIEVYLTEDHFKTPDDLVTMARRIHSALQAGKDVTALIKQHSSGAFARNGGDSGEIGAGELRSEIQQVLSGLKIGQISDIMPVEDGVFIFRLLDKSHPQPLPFNKVVNQIRTAYGARVVNEELKKYLMAIKDQTYVEIVEMVR